MREYLARRGSAKIKQEHLRAARLPILGYCLESLKIDGQNVRKAFLQPETQAEVDLEGYDKGAVILTDFFKRELEKFDTPELNPIGKKILDMCMNDASLEDYLSVIPMRY